MPSVRKEGQKTEVVWDWGSHVDKMIREAQARGDFDNLPGAGKPLQLDDNIFAGDMQSAYRIAKNAGAAPLWVQLDKEIEDDGAALDAMLERTARYLEAQAARLTPKQPEQPEQPPQPADQHAQPGTPSRQNQAAAGHDQVTPSPVRRWWPFSRAGRSRDTGSSAAGGAGVPRLTYQQLEGERLRARNLYLQKAADLDHKIEEYNSHRPRTLDWLEKTRLLPHVAARHFDERIPPLAPPAPAAGR